MPIKASELKKNNIFQCENGQWVAISDWSICGIHVVRQENYNEYGVYSYDVVENLEIDADNLVEIINEE